MISPASDKCIFVGGVHGMGKSSLCSNAATALKIGHYTASDLIKRFSHLDEGLYKEVRSVGRNQEILLSAIQEFVKHPVYILDGHFVIRSEGFGLSRIPVETYAAIRPCAIVVVTGDTHIASARMKVRDGREITHEQLAEMQTMEIKHATAVASSLNVPFFNQSTTAPEDFLMLIRKTLVT